MDEYLTQDEYVAFGGKGSFDTEAEFKRYETRARRLIDVHTFERVSSLSEIPVEIKYLTFELIDKIRSDDRNAGIQSESLDKWSRTYTARSPLELEHDYSVLISRYLSGLKTADGIPLLYTGVDAL